MNEIFRPKFIIKFIVKKSNITEILFIISNLLSGKRKIDVQNKLIELKFIERIINPLFDILFNVHLIDSPESLFNDEEDNTTNPVGSTRV